MAPSRSTRFGAVVRLGDQDGTLQTELLFFDTWPYPREIRERVLDAAGATAVSIAELDFRLGELFAAQLRHKLAALAGHKGPTSTLSWNGQKTLGDYLIEEVLDTLDDGNGAFPPTILDRSVDVAFREGLNVLAVHAEVEGLSQLQNFGAFLAQAKTSGVMAALYNLVINCTASIVRSLPMITFSLASCTPVSYDHRRPRAAMLESSS